MFSNQMASGTGDLKYVLTYFRTLSGWLSRGEDGPGKAFLIFFACFAVAFASGVGLLVKTSGMLALLLCAGSLNASAVVAAGVAGAASALLST